jgi:hypothetical protein
MPPKPHKSNRPLVFVVAVSFVLFAIALVLQLGIQEVNAPDSQGRPMGFNDPLSWEHYGMMVQHFRPVALFRWWRWYDWVLLGMQIMGATLLWRRNTTSARNTRSFFAAQPLFFPLGVPSMLILPFILFNHLLGDLGDREGFEDVPFSLMIAQGSWLWASLIIAVAFHGPKPSVREWLYGLWSRLRGTHRGSATV